jgi:hypothetical protein
VEGGRGEKRKQNCSSIMKFGIKSAQRCVIHGIPVIPKLRMGGHGAVEVPSLSVVQSV